MDFRSLDVAVAGFDAAATFFADLAVFLRARPADADVCVFRLEAREVRFFLAAINRLPTDFAVFFAATIRGIRDEKSDPVLFSFREMRLTPARIRGTR